MTADQIKALVERLRYGTYAYAELDQAATKAADAIEALSLENQRLRVESLTRKQIEDIAGACLETPRFHLFMQYVDHAFSKVKS
jgi:hypothetical protein